MPSKRSMSKRVEGASADPMGTRAHLSTRPLQHLPGSTPGEGQQHNARWRHTLLDQPRDPMNERASLSRTRTGNHPVRTTRGPCGPLLGRIEG
jgi:hypothetical protein